MAGLYIHIPFCERKCRYCDFYSEEFSPSRRNNRANKLQINPESLFVFSDFLIREIELFVTETGNVPAISSIFFGGGTPSLLSPARLEKIIKKIQDVFEITPGAEITLESNPGTVSLEKLKAYRTAGINRLSIGAQSFVQSELRFLERIHSPAKIKEAFQQARHAGFDNINIDLMFSVPGQTKKSVAYSLEQTIELKPEHISSYSLIFEPGTPLFDDLQSGKVKKLSNDEDADLYDYTMNFLRSTGYIQYEVSNYALSQKYKCTHNMNYWNGGEYLGFGPSAHGFLKNKRYWNISDLSRYYELLSDDTLPVESSEDITKADRVNELIMLGLRAEGLYINDLKKEFDVDLFSVAGEYVQEMIESGFLSYDGKKLAATSKGYKVCDEIILKIISAL